MVDRWHVDVAYLRRIVGEGITFAW